MSNPVFAVVGHPNKGKSSIVSTLSRQDAVTISELSGTTTRSQEFSLEVDGQSLYRLIDTPGFQRPRQALDWIKEHSTNASERQAAVAAFIQAFQDVAINEKFHDETELLTPIMAGAGIIYVVDGSIPYAPEYEAEMTILQWTGQPRMALINPIGGNAFVAQWQSALSQYFSVVRVFDPMTADQTTQVTVLKAFAELYEPWRLDIEQSVSQLQHYFGSLQRKGAHIVVEALLQILQHETSTNVPTEILESGLREKTKLSYQQSIRQMESQMQRHLQELFSHHQLQLTLDTVTADYPDLFDKSSWYLFGLDRQKLIGLATSAGAAAGAVVDVGLGGASLMTGAIAGGLISGGATLLATLRPEKLKVKGVPIAGKKIIAGPIKDIRFAFVLLGRAIDFLELVSERTHADRRVMTLVTTEMSSRLKCLKQVDQVMLTRLLQKAHNGLSEKDQSQLIEWVCELSNAKQTNVSKLG